MTGPPERQRGPDDGPPRDPMDAARRYAPPGRRYVPATGSHQSPQQPGAGPELGQPSSGEQQQHSNVPMVLGILGIVGWFLCGVGAIGSIIVGRIGQRKARELGQSDLLPKIAWVGGIVTIVGDVVVYFLYRPGG